MESINDILSWLTDHESAFSAIAALVVIFGVVLSPLGAGLRGLLTGRGHSIQNEVSVSEAAETEEANISTTQNFLTTPPPLITDKPSIAVLPFVNMSKDDEKEFFADGMTEDIITGLSCDSRLFVIARNSTFAYKGQSPDIRTVGKELGVRYVLEGSIRPVGERLRITVQLIETDTGSHIWADKIDRPVTEIFDIQDDVVDSLVATLCANLSAAEGQRVQRQAPGDLKVWELCVQAEMAWMGQRTVDGLIQAQASAKKATEIEPGYALGWALLAYFSSLNIAYLITDSNSETAKQVDELINKAAKLAPNDPTVLGYMGYAAAFAGNASVGVDYLERSLAINPNSGIFRQAYAGALVAASRHDEAFVEHELFFRQSPLDPSLGVAYFWRSWSLSAQGKYEEAKTAADLGIKRLPTFTWLWVSLAMALAGLGQSDTAQKAMQQVREMSPHFTLHKIEAAWRFLNANPEHAEQLASLSRKAWSSEAWSSEARKD